ncbi:replicative DNA helicase [Mycoplasma sp. Mirounga ES2805-ORL]|uniref:replicative DNA helicase n=1 Tax=Mycoplasma sp. Mirounga ES2805-ORL TaxID=754514 RepID=UPI00197C89EF|nr:replicative DNA helicase [Mycoplasma sp. Mirounga ES2805-ORL]QSF13584.1 replicative DNA helicase [Mycoplasma sp. Mirounga ES2805-ORL]
MQNSKNDEYINQSAYKTTHVNKDYEDRLLSIVLSNNKKAGQIIPYLVEEDFVFYENKIFFKIVSSLYKANLSINDDHIIDFAEKNKYEAVVNRQLLTYYYSINAFSSNIPTYLKEITRLTQLRNIEKGLIEVQNNIQKNVNIDTGDILWEIQKIILDVDRTKINSDFLTAREVSEEYYKNLQIRRLEKEGSITGLPTGYNAFDTVTQGLQPNELIILAARPGMGKTALALNIAINNAIKQRNVAFFSLEMSPEQLMARIYSIVTEINSFKLKKPSLLTDLDLVKINSARNKKIEPMSLFIDDSVGTDLENLIWKCRRLHKVNPLDLIIIDYLQLIPTKKQGRNAESRQQEVGRISRALKTLAKDLKIPVIALSQLSREVDKREQKRPQMTDLRESGNIEQDADIIMMLYRESYYNTKKQNDDAREQLKIDGEDIGVPIDLIIAKHRNGPPFDTKLRFIMSQGRFEDHDDDDKSNKYEKMED